MTIILSNFNWFKNISLVRFLSKFAVKRILKIPSHLAYVATLLCETLISAKHALNDKLQSGVATYFRCCEAVDNQIKEGLLLSVRQSARTLSGRVRSGPVGSGRARVVEFSYYDIPLLTAFWTVWSRRHTSLVPDRFHTSFRSHPLKHNDEINNCTEASSKQMNSLGNERLMSLSNGVTRVIDARGQKQWNAPPPKKTLKIGFMAQFTASVQFAPRIFWEEAHGLDGNITTFSLVHQTLLCSLDFRWGRIARYCLLRPGATALPSDPRSLRHWLCAKTII